MHYMPIKQNLIHASVVERCDDSEDSPYSDNSSGKLTAKRYTKQPDGSKLFHSQWPQHRHGRLWKPLIVCCEGCFCNCPWNAPFINLCSISTASTEPTISPLCHNTSYSDWIVYVCLLLCCVLFFKPLHKSSKRLHVASCCKHTFGAKLWLCNTCQNWSRVLLNNLDLNEVLYTPLPFRNQTTALCSTQPFGCCPENLFTSE